MPDSDELLNKLKSMGVNLGAGHINPQQKPRRNSYGIETVIQGADFETGYGLTFMVQEQYPADYRHGLVPLCTQCEMDVLAAYSGTPRITQPGGCNVVFLDTETSGLMGGTGTYAFLIGIGYRTESGFELIQFFMRDPDQEQALLAALDQWLARFNAVVTFNGKSFDLPLLTTRYTMNGFTAPFGSFEHVDVLHIARKLWRDRLPSRALGELEKEIVRFYRSNDDIPGWMIPEIYFEYLRSGDARPLAGVIYHNARDILSLAALYGHVAGMLKDPINQAAGYALDLAAIARLYEGMGWIEKAARLYERSLEMGDLPEDFFFKTMERYALLHRRQGDWEKAANLWKMAGEKGQVFACIELAKYYEHRERNYVEALQWAKKALENIEIDRYYFGSGRALEKDIERRIGRLYQRVHRSMD
jgi:tetratricopeptide (TPR) repeat protein